MGAPRPDRIHVPAADLTAFAHGEFTEWHRAEISRHILACEACRRTLEESREVLGLLREAGRVGIEGLRADAAARRPAFASRALRALATAGSIAAIVALGVVLAPPRGRDGSPPPTTAAASEPALSPEQTALLGVQRADGRWAAEASLGGARRDEAATGLALLALLPTNAEDLRSGPVARAVAEGTRWLRSRQKAPGGIGDDGQDHAVATCALIEVYALTGDARLKASLDRALRGLAPTATEPDGAARVDPSLGWSLHALTRARALGWRHLDARIRRVEEQGVNGSLAGLARVAASPVAARADAPCALALRVLRDRSRS